MGTSSAAQEAVSVRRIGFHEFMSQSGEAVARSELEAFAEEILAALKGGATYTAVAAWLRANGVERVTRQSLQQWVQRRQARAARRAAQLETDRAQPDPTGLPDDAPATVRLLSTFTDEALLGELHRRGLVGAGLRAALPGPRGKRRGAGSGVHSAS